jgi:hypothetical protein
MINLSQEFRSDNIIQFIPAGFSKPRVAGARATHTPGYPGIPVSGRLGVVIEIPVYRIPGTPYFRSSSVHCANHYGQRGLFGIPNT